MRREFLAIFFIAAAGSAQSADVFSRERDPPTNMDDSLPLRGPIHRDWEGFYVGLSGAWINGRDHETDALTTGAPTGFDRSYGVSGSGIGIYVGQAWETNRFVYGFEADAEKSFARGALSSGALGRVDSWIGYDASLRARAGYSFDNLLVYGTAGAAFLGASYKDSSPVGIESYSRTPVGWTVGLGAEWSFGAHWAARLEYRYASFGAASLRSAVAFPGIVEKHALSTQTIRAGVSYRFTGY